VLRTRQDLHPQCYIERKAAPDHTQLQAYAICKYNHLQGSHRPAPQPHLNTVLLHAIRGKFIKQKGLLAALFID
jgi:hypothetical protein